MILPKWIPPKDHAHILDDGQVRNLIEGITIAVDGIHAALAPLGTGKCKVNKCEGCQVETEIAIDELKEALRRIEELGK